MPRVVVSRMYKINVTNLIAVLDSSQIMYLLILQNLKQK